MEDKLIAERVVDMMYNNDPFTQWLGIERLRDGPGISVIRMEIRGEMLNGFSIAHGGICYALADSALAFACNGHGIKAVSVETSISHTERVQEGDLITATAEEVSLSNKIGVYHVTVTNQHGKKVALFKGTVYRSGESWFPAEE